MSLLHSSVKPELEVILRPIVLTKITSTGYVPGYSTVFKETLGPNEIGVYLFTIDALKSGADKKRSSSIMVALVLLHSELAVLQSFQLELDSFCKNLQSQLLQSAQNKVPHSTTEILVSVFVFSELDSTTLKLVDSWFHESIDFLFRAINALSDCLQHFLFSVSLSCTLSNRHSHSL